MEIITLAVTIATLVLTKAFTNTSEDLDKKVEEEGENLYSLLQNRFPSTADDIKLAQKQPVDERHKKLAKDLQKAANEDREVAISTETLARLLITSQPQIIISQPYNKFINIDTINDFRDADITGFAGEAKNPTVIINSSEKGDREQSSPDPKEESSESPKYSRSLPALSELEGLDDLILRRGTIEKSLFSLDNWNNWELQQAIEKSKAATPPKPTTQWDKAKREQQIEDEQLYQGIEYHDFNQMY